MSKKLEGDIALAVHRAICEDSWEGDHDNGDSHCWRAAHEVLPLVDTSIDVKLGLYRNGLGAELEVTRNFSYLDRGIAMVLNSDIYVATSAPDILNHSRTFLVTKTSLQSAGYELVKEAS